MLNCNLYKLELILVLSVLELESSLSGSYVLCELIFKHYIYAINCELHHHFLALRT